MFIQTQNHKKERSKEDRYWLPGPPPRRRLKGLDTLEFSYPSSLPNLHVPIRAVDLWSNDNRKSKTLAPYFQRKTLDSGTSPKPEALYLFHGCASEISPALLRSFSKYGPSIHFSRPRSYFSRTPAVYWTDSLDFAFAWCVFSETGRWLPEISSESPPFECLVYVSKVDSTILDDRNAAFLVPVPNSDASEQELVDWCNANLQKSAAASRIAPPSTNRTDWSLIGSRIPRHTMDSLVRIEFPNIPALGKTNVHNMWMYAACDEFYSELIASAGLEILHLSSRYTAFSKPKL